ncbi:MAG: M48 family metallopeptidase [Pseudomonadota bacterium]
MATFFEQQDAARRNTKVLVLLFALAVAGVIVAVDFVLATAYLWSGYARLPWPGATVSLSALYGHVPAALYGWGAAGTALVVLGASVRKVAQLAQGGRKVAEMVGARRVRPDTSDFLERRYLNVVEEMAIAAGMRVPAAYVMDGEPGINAFAAGYEPYDAVVVVTRGALDKLDRDELQGLIGHEFSHILNGDMRLNVRMLGVLAGIVFIGSAGEFLIRSQRGRSRASGQLLALGLALAAIGYVGLFFARLIKAAAARQREFLADASSVQFTRNPEGIAGALDRIRAEPAGALVQNRYAEDLSHMFFAESVSLWFERLFATHPPIEERIRRVHPGFQPAIYRSRRAREAPAGEQADAAGAARREAVAAAVLGEAAALAGSGRRAGDLGTQWGRQAGESAALVGTLDAAKVDYTRRLLAALPVELRERLRTREGACAALVALLLAPDEAVRRAQLAALAGQGLAGFAERAGAVAPLAARLGPAFHLPVIDLALPAAKAAPLELRRDTLRALEVVIRADRRVSLHEFVVLTLARDQLLPAAPPSGWPKRIADLRKEAALVLALVAQAGARADAPQGRDAAVHAAVEAGAAEMGLDVQAAAGAQVTLENAAAALEALRHLAPLQKAILVKGLFAAATHDGTIRLAEAELLRLVAAVLDCPLPPLLGTLDPATLAA